MVNATGFDVTLLRGLVLAGGDGRRLQSYVQQFKGGELPKQYVNFVGRRSMLEHTFHRAESLIPAERIFTVISRQHLAHAEVRRQLASRPKETLIVQPANKDTGPGILLPAMFIYKRCPEAIVVLFPSDHFILEEDRFMSHVRLAVQAVTHEPTRIVLLAIEPHEPETDYGYVVPHKDAGGPCRFGTRAVSAFVEKPRTDMAFKLMMGGGLWNTMTMVFKLATLLELARRVHPLYLYFCRILEALGTAEEQRTVEEVYQVLEPVNFSKEIMTRIGDRYPRSLSVLPVRKVFWSDWGSPERVLQAIRRLDHDYGGETQAKSRGNRNQGYAQRPLPRQ
jgi:mannose-1-phosphate guanylyltransferase